MRSRCLFFTLSVLVVLGAVDAAPAQVRGGAPDPSLSPVELNEKAWKPFTPKDGCVTISMPGIPAPRTQTLAGPNGIQMEQHLYILKTASVEYIVGVTELPIVVKDERVADAIYSANRDRMTQQLGAKIESEKPTDFFGHHGRKYVLVAQETYVRMHIAIVGDRMVSLLMERPGSSTDATFEIAAERFFGSIHEEAPCKGQ